MILLAQWGEGAVGAVRPVSLTLVPTEPRRRVRAVSEITRRSRCSPAATGAYDSNAACAVLFCPGCRGVEPRAFSLKRRACPHSGRRGTLNRHSLLSGNDPDSADGRCQRGQRAYCSRRGWRGGCGRSFSFFFADILPRHTVSSSWLWRLLVAWLTGLSLKGAAGSLACCQLQDPFTLHPHEALRPSSTGG
jgi:hypothetical protein